MSVIQMTSGKVEKTCSQCDNIFITRLSRENKFCSSVCFHNSTRGVSTWNKGLTAETNISMKKISDKNKITYSIRQDLRYRMRNWIRDNDPMLWSRAGKIGGKVTNRLYPEMIRSNFKTGRWKIYINKTFFRPEQNVIIGIIGGDFLTKYIKNNPNHQKEAFAKLLKKNPNHQSIVGKKGGIIAGEIAVKTGRIWKMLDEQMKRGGTLISHGLHKHRSKGELKTCNKLYLIFGDNLLSNRRVGRCEVDFVVTKRPDEPTNQKHWICVIEYHPRDPDVYEKSRLHILRSLGITCKIFFLNGCRENDMKVLEQLQVLM